MHLKISSPESVIFNDTIQKVTLPTWVGEITILPWHQPISTVLFPWLVTITTDADLWEGFVRKDNQVILSVSKGLVLVDGENIVITTSVGVTSPSESHEVLTKMQADLEAELEKIKVEGNKEELEAALMNLEKVNADVRLAKFWKIL